MLALYISMMETQEEKIIFEKFYTENVSFFLNYANKILNNRAKAEDAVHEAFLSVIKNKEKYFELSCRDLRRLTVVIVRNKCLDIISKDKKYSDIPYENLEIYLESDNKSLDEQISTMDELEAMKLHLNSLDELTREILILKYVQDMTYDEIAEVTGLSRKNVDTRIYRGKKKLREMLQKEDRNGK